MIGWTRYNLQASKDRNETPSANTPPPQPCFLGAGLVNQSVSDLRGPTAFFSMITPSKTVLAFFAELGLLPEVEGAFAEVEGPALLLEAGLLEGPAFEEAALTAEEPATLEDLGLGGVAGASSSSSSSESAMTLARAR